MSYQLRRTLLTGAELLTDKHHERLEALFKADQHVEVQTTWDIYQRLVSAYRQDDKKFGKWPANKLIESISTEVPKAPVEIRTLGRTLKRRASDILAHFDHSRTSNGPTEATNDRLEHLRGSALGFTNFNNYITRSLVETGGFKPKTHPQL